MLETTLLPVLPIQPSIEMFFLLCGLLFGETFSGIDSAAKKTTWFTSDQRVLVVWLKETFFDFFHHWQYGFVLAIIALFGYVPVPYLSSFIFTPETNLAMYAFGWGLMIDDWKDLKNLIRRYEKWANGEATLLQIGKKPNAGKPTENHG